MNSMASMAIGIHKVAVAVAPAISDLMAFDHFDRTPLAGQAGELRDPQDPQSSANSLSLFGA